MRSRIAKTTANMPPARSGPRQFRTVRSLDPLLDIVQQLHLISAICRYGVGRWHLESIPDAIELPHAAAESSGDFCACVNGCLGPSSPAPREFVQIVAIRSIATNRQPLALRQAREQSKIDCAQSGTEVTAAFELARQHKPFVFRASSCEYGVAKIRQWSY